jgi:FkbM family methyltransferase
MNKDYSQHGEQAHILKFFGERKGRFLDIGAFDGVTGSNTMALAELGWSGVCIEANPFNFPKLIANKLPQVEYINAAVMSQAGLVKFVDAQGQCGTCLEKPFLPGSLIVREYRVAAITPKMICDAIGGDFDFISLDVEGVDLDVLRGLAPVATAARLLCIEDSIPCRPFDAEHYSQLRLAAATLGLSKVIARTPTDDGTGNTLLAKE